MQYLMFVHSGGAMRLPGKVEDPVKIHFLTDYYVNKFVLDRVPFNNSDGHGLLKFYNDPPVTFTGIVIVLG